MLNLTLLSGVSFEDDCEVLDLVRGLILDRDLDRLDSDGLGGASVVVACDRFLLLLLFLTLVLLRFTCLVGFGVTMSAGF